MNETYELFVVRDIRIYLVILIYLVAINLIGFFAMWLDKRKAQKGNFRISEKALMYITLFGGGIGTISGMYTFRHKTKKLKFSIGFPVITITEAILLVYCFVKFW